MTESGGGLSLSGAADGFQTFADMMPRRASAVEKLAALDDPELAARIEAMEAPREIEVFIHGMGMIEARRMTFRLDADDE